jgi:hypothetical protein
MVYVIAYGTRNRATTIPYRSHIHSASPRLPRSALGTCTCAGLVSAENCPPLKRKRAAMDRPEVDRILGEVERRLAKGEQIDLKQLGFWRAVEGVKRHREWIEAYADRVSAIERVVFRRSTWIDVPCTWV